MSKEFKPHDYQAVIIDHIQTHPRCNVFASPGMGKTASTLMALDALALTDTVFPALVFGPLRVANSVWHREVEKWAQLKGLRVSRVIGTAPERMAALKQPADIYTTHYGLITWLEAALNKTWPFKTVIADESTRLKNQRCSFQKSKTGKVFLRKAGSSNASTLACYAPKTARWVNLTGTPAPNGVKDLWGQQWYLDFGKALGKSYTDFVGRWFYQRIGTSAEQAIFEPHSHSQAEITARIAPLTISVNAYDYFDCEQPREVDIEVELSEAIMKDYRKLHREAVLRLSEEVTITAVNAGVITNKCLQYASGHIFDEMADPHWVHDEKLEALESLVENLNGAPVIVAYAFTPDRAAILKRFKNAEVLPSGARQQEVEDRWNAGKIPMLVVHPASCGHGLNLQYGGCDVVFYSVGWDLELYQQLIERIGPVRQMQAGFKRIVSVYRMLAKGTFDEVVADRLSGKATVQDIIFKELRATSF